MKKVALPTILAAASIFAVNYDGYLAQAAETAAPTVKLIANITKPAEDYTTVAFQMFAARATKQTNGRVAVDVHFGGELGFKAGDGLRVLENHSVDISETVGAFEGTTVPDIMITTLPFFITSFDEFAFFDRLFRPHLNKLFAAKKAKCLLTYSLTLQHFWNKKKVDTIAELAGVRMRTYDKVTTDMLVALGAAPLRIDFTELFMALQQGTVDGMVTGLTALTSLKLYEVVKYGNLTGFSTGGLNCLAINLDAWNKLAGEYKVGLTEAASEVENWLRVRVPAIEREGLEELKTKGMTINVVPPSTIAEMRKRTEKIRLEFLNSRGSPELRAIVDEYEQVRGLK